jgi:hypothetical protein
MQLEPRSYLYPIAATLHLRAASFEKTAVSGGSEDFLGTDEPVGPGTTSKNLEAAKHSGAAAGALVFLCLR